MLYVINGLGTTLYKIGYSAANPERRLNELQTGSPYDLKLILLTDGEREDEAKIHNWMEKKGWRIKGEWFDIKNHDLFQLAFAIGLNREIKHRPVSILSNASSEKKDSESIFESFLERGWRYEKTSSFNTMLGTAFEDFWHEYFMYCKKYTEPSLKPDEVSRKLYDLKIGHKIDDQGTYIFNLRKK